MKIWFAFLNLSKIEIQIIKKIKEIKICQFLDNFPQENSFIFVFWRQFDGSNGFLFQVKFRIFEEETVKG